MGGGSDDETGKGVPIIDAGKRAIWLGVQRYTHINIYTDTNNRLTYDYITIHTHTNI